MRLPSLRPLLLLIACSFSALLALAPRTAAGETVPLLGNGRIAARFAGDAAGNRFQLELPGAAEWGELKVDWLDGDQATTQFREALDLQTGVATVRFQRGGAGITVTSFCSAADGLLVVHLRANKPGALNFQVQIRQGHADQARTAVVEERRMLVMKNQASPAFEARAWVYPMESEVTPGKDQITVRGEGEALILFAAEQSATSPAPSLAGRLEPLGFGGEEHPDVYQIWTGLLERQEAEHRSWMDRFRLELEAAEGSTAIQRLRAEWLARHRPGGMLGAIPTTSTAAGMLAALEGRLAEMTGLGEAQQASLAARCAAASTDAKAGSATDAATGAWLGLQLWDRWRFGQDRAFLKETAWPWMAAQARSDLARLAGQGANQGPESRAATAHFVCTLAAAQVLGIEEPWLAELQARVEKDARVLPALTGGGRTTTDLLGSAEILATPPEGLSSEELQRFREVSDALRHLSGLMVSREGHDPLLREHGDPMLSLLPSLSAIAEWPAGKVKGLCAPGGLRVGFQWQGQKISGERVERIAIPGLPSLPMPAAKVTLEVRGETKEIEVPGVP